MGTPVEDMSQTGREGPGSTYLLVVNEALSVLARLDRLPGPVAHDLVRKRRIHLLKIRHHGDYDHFAWMILGTVSIPGSVYIDAH